MNRIETQIMKLVSITTLNDPERAFIGILKEDWIRLKYILAAIVPLVEAVEKVREKTLAGVINVEQGRSNGLDAKSLDNILRTALPEFYKVLEKKHEE